ncbi:MAG TPA: hypothetical protein VFG69_05010 [Nannocystaceae bacterium]|nr:hypothetical protein [Nannocystaceae bacterium]
MVSGRSSSVAMLIVCACTPTRPVEADRAPAPDERVRVTGDDALELPIITTMRTRDREVVVFASARGLRFTVRDSEGFVLADRLDRAGFADAFPTLGQHFDTAFAGETLWLDASVERDVLPEK